MDQSAKYLRATYNDLFCVIIEYFQQKSYIHNTNNIGPGGTNEKQTRNKHMIKGGGGKSQEA